MISFIIHDSGSHILKIRLRWGSVIYDNYNNAHIIDRTPELICGMKLSQFCVELPICELISLPPQGTTRQIELKNMLNYDIFAVIDNQETRSTVPNIFSFKVVYM